MATVPLRGRAYYFDYLTKLLLIGDGGVGKTCLMLRFSGEPFQTSFLSTIGIDYKTKIIELDGKRIKLQLWDTAGQERFLTITRNYYAAARGILLVYDVTDESSFNTHKDESKRAVSTSRGQALADEYGIKFFETSAKTNFNVEQVFFSIARDIKERLAESEFKAEPNTVKFPKSDSTNAKTAAPEISACCGL
ncbi:hypothetical protein SLA2020_008550 [Shorea laevis]